MEIALGRKCHPKALGFVDPDGPGTFPATGTERKSSGFIRDLPKILTSFSEDVQVNRRGFQGQNPSLALGCTTVYADTLSVQAKAGQSASPCALM